MFLASRVFRTAMRMSPLMRTYPIRFFSNENKEEPIDVQQEILKKDAQRQTFKAETKKLLDIVARSLYTDKEVYVRELVSNAADALEKQKFQQISGQAAPGEDLRINITTNENQGTFVIEDNGIGMTREEMIENLGTIAQSGSRKFIENLGAKEGETKRTAENIIGQFGVGFYSAFIVAKEVQVISRTKDCTQAHFWQSDGTGNYEIADFEDNNVKQGTKITVYLRDECKNFANQYEVNKILKKYSNYVTFPLQLNGHLINEKQAIWTRNKNEISEQEYRDFFEYLSGAKIPYKYLIHLNLDIPIQIKALIYIPATHKEGYGMGNEQSEIDLYSRRVLIKQKCSELLPQWLRFCKGIVDCEDIPLNISRETYQDSALMARIRSLLSKRVIKLLSEQSIRNEESYNLWYKDFQNFISEGLVMDQENNKEIASLARFSWSLGREVVSLPKYVQSMKQNQKKIYYLFSPTYDSGMRSPYLESFLPNNVPVIISQSHIDEMIFQQLDNFQGFKFINVESNQDQIEQEIISKQKYKKDGIPEKELVGFTEWLKNELSPTVKSVKVSQRLQNYPAIVIGDLPSSVRQVYRLMDQERREQSGFSDGQTLEINPNHEIMVRINRLRKQNPAFAKLVAKAVCDNAQVQAGVLDDPAPMLERMNKILTVALRREEEGTKLIS